MKTLEKGSFLDLLLVLDNYIKKVERAQAEYDKLKKNKNG